MEWFQYVLDHPEKDWNYSCLSENPNITFEKGMKPNISLTFLGITSIVLFLCIRIHTYFYNKKITNANTFRPGQNLFSFIATGLGIFSIGFIFLSRIFFKIMIIKSIDFNYHIVYILYMYAPVIGFAFCIWGYYAQCPNLRSRVHAEICYTLQILQSKVNNFPN